MTKGNSLERILVTSYLNKEVISKKYKIALLGDWCIPNNTKNSIKEYDFITLNYHWNNRKNWKSFSCNRKKYFSSNWYKNR